MRQKKVLILPPLISSIKISGEKGDLIFFSHNKLHFSEITNMDKIKKNEIASSNLFKIDFRKKS